MRKLLASLFLLITLGIVSCSNADPQEDPFAAYNRGDYATALSLLRPLATQGDAWAQTSLGFMYHNGQGVPRDDKEAIRWYRLAAAQGYALAQYNLGVMSNNGQGVPQDDKEAVRWYRLAAAQGNAEAQYNLGLMYATGRGVPQDDKEAVRLYRIAAAQGNASAQNNLGRMYATGQGVPQDDKEAVRWYRLAAAQGNAEAQYNLRLRYEQEEAVLQDNVRAHMWYSFNASDKSQKRTDTKMTSAQIAQAQEMAQRCQASIVDRVKAGLAHARSKGVKLGRKPVSLRVREQVTLLRGQKMTQMAIARKIGISQAKVSQILNTQT